MQSSKDYLVPRRYKLWMQNISSKDFWNCQREWLWHDRWQDMHGDEIDILFQKEAFISDEKSLT